MSALPNPRRPEPNGPKDPQRVERQEIRVISYATAAYEYSANGDLLTVARMPPKNATGDSPDADQKVR